MGRIGVGFSMHPRWLGEGDLDGFLAPLLRAGLTAVEFGLDATDPDLPRAQGIMAACRTLGLALAFHAPYRQAYNIAGFAGERRALFEAMFSPMLEIAAAYGPAPLVVHGARAADRPYEALVSDTVAFLQWLLSRFGALRPALENLAPDPQQAKVATTHAGLAAVVERVADSRLGFCWDIGHDVAGGCAQPPEASWLGRVRHVHVHDLDAQGVDHYPFMYGRVQPQHWLHPLVEAGFAGVVTLELKGGQLIGLPPDRLTAILTESVHAIADAVGVR